VAKKFASRLIDGELFKVRTCSQALCTEPGRYCDSAVPSVSRFVVGAAFGLLLVIGLAVPALLFSVAFQPDPNRLATEFQGCCHVAS
jgi:hypothetical protein